MRTRGQYPPFLLTIALAAAILSAACARPTLVVLIDPLYEVAEPAAAKALMAFRLRAHARRIEVFEPGKREIAAAIEGADAILASPLALAALAELPRESLPGLLLAYDAPVPAALAGRVRVARSDNAEAWRSAGTIAADFLAASGGGVAGFVLVEGPGRSALRIADFSGALGAAGAKAPLVRVLPADADASAMDAALDEFLKQDLRFACVAGGALGPAALLRLAQAGIVTVSDQYSLSAALVIQDDLEAALRGLAAAGEGGPLAIQANSLLVRGPGWDSALARIPGLAALSKRLPRAEKP